MFLLVNFTRTAEKEKLVGTSVKILIEVFSSYIIKEAEKYLQILLSRNRIYHICRYIFPVQLYTC